MHNGLGNAHSGKSLTYKKHAQTLYFLPVTDLLMEGAATLLLTLPIVFWEVLFDAIFHYPSINISIRLLLSKFPSAAFK